MGWIRTHPYASLFALAGIMLLAISLALGGSRVGLLGENTTGATSSGTIFPTSNVVSNVPGTPVTAETALPRYANSSNYTTTAQGEGSAGESVPDASDSALALFLSSLSQPQQNTLPDTSVGDALLREIYSFIPSGVTVFGGTRTQARTPAQQALYTYGNGAGFVILSFENAHTDMVDDLKNWFENRKSGGYKASVEQIADDMAAAGTALSALSDVPPAAASANQRLAESLQAAADKLKAVTAATGDSGIADAMKTYNTSAEEFTRSYIALADIFTLNEVTFNQSDSGSAFSMPH